jgi:hypothetical protein
MHSLTSAVGCGQWSYLRSAYFIPGERTSGTHWIGGWMGRGDVYETPCLAENRIPVVQPID